MWLSIFYYNEYNSNYKKLLVNKYNISNLNIYPTQENFTLKKKIIFNEIIDVELNNYEIYSFNIFKNYMIFIKKFNKKYNIKEKKITINFDKTINKFFYLIIKKNNDSFIIRVHQHNFILPYDAYIEKITIYNLQKFNQNQITI